ncbi:MAG TPA: peptidoglycan recognition family protein [Candidatus Saccharimonadales bacterium]|nr:peptidoglycan recognition family protein [Candidatus Saccharimonadales bacterium]
MPKYPNDALWLNAFTKPDWYLDVKDEFRRLEKLAVNEKDYYKRKSIKRPAYSLVETAVRENKIILAQSGKNFDRERRPIDTIVIHHTSNKPGMTLGRLNAMELLRIYGMHYADPPNPLEKNLTGQPVWSGHFYNDQQVFWCYHWFIREDGQAERLLKDEYIGWHAGNWDINTSSIAICIDDDLSDKKPSEIVLNAIAEIIKQHYPGILTSNILGHREVNPKTVCPGDLFIDGWKGELLKKIEKHLKR